MGIFFKKVSNLFSRSYKLKMNEGPRNMTKGQFHIICSPSQVLVHLAAT